MATDDKQNQHPIRSRALAVRQLFLVVSDMLITVAASFLSVWIRFDFSYSKMENRFLENLISTILPNILLVPVIFFLFGLYKSLWQYAGMHELMRIVFACITADILQFFLFKIYDRTMPRSYWVLYLFILCFFTVALRFAYRFIRLISVRMRQIKGGSTEKRIMVVGAGDAGNMLIKEIKTSDKLNADVVCAIDDNPRIVGSTIRGVKVVGNCESIVENAEKYLVDQIIIAMPSVGRKRISEIADICSHTGCELKIIPGIYEFVNEDVSLSQIRDVEIEDLLGRDPVVIDVSRILESISKKTVLVTGGGGSIGSELCRQIADADPKKLIIVDIYENNAYDIQQELKRNFPALDLVVLIASVRNYDRIDKIFSEYRPDLVFHAAAHKHVPLMEDSPNEAIKNNVFGTLNTARAADKYGVKRFVLISTDKAVNPTNVMGASKRICEMIIQEMAKHSKTTYVAVRFGNVLGSNGSVIPLFKEQIKAGGPVTVTDPNIIRYFMTIPEAVSLVLEAGTYAAGGEIYVLDMGEPVKIIDLAKNLIRLSGLTPGEDIDIVYTGLRPGEKLYEERLMDEEGLNKTENDMISVAKPIDMNGQELFSKLEELYTAVYEETDDVRQLIARIVPTYKPWEAH